MEFSFVRIISFFSLFLLLEHNYLLRTAYVLCLEISSSVQTKKKQLTPAFSPLLLLAKVANECFKCAEKVFRLYRKHTLLVSISRLDGIPSYARPLNTVPVEEGFI